MRIINFFNKKPSTFPELREQREFYGSCFSEIPVKIQPEKRAHKYSYGSMGAAHNPHARAIIYFFFKKISYVCKESSHTPVNVTSGCSFGRISTGLQREQREFCKFAPVNLFFPLVWA